MKTFKLTDEEVLVIKKRLPSKAMSRIAKDLKITREYVYQVLNNKKPQNKQIIEAAINLIENETESDRQLRERFENITKK